MMGIMVTRAVVETYEGREACWISNVDSSDWVTTESWGYARRTSRFQYGFCAGSEAVGRHGHRRST